METIATFGPQVQADVEEGLEHVNGGHPDTVLFVARHKGAPDATAAELRSADPGGVTLELQGPDGTSTLRVPFPAPAANADEVQVHLMVMLHEARTAAGDSVPLTSLERELASTPEIAVHPVVVGERRPVATGLWEVDLHGPAGLEPNGPDAFYFVLTADDPSVLDADYSIARYQADAEAGTVAGAYYTVRRWDPSTGTLTIWVVDHDHPGTVSSRLCTAERGERLALWGPRVAFEPPRDPEAVLVVADETGLAAVARILEHLTDDVRVEAVLEVADAEHRAPLPDHPGLHVRWLHRDGCPAGANPELLAAVEALELDGAEWWAFGAAESRQITAVRRLLRHERGLPAERVSMTGYWRR